VREEVGVALRLGVVVADEVKLAVLVVLIVGVTVAVGEGVALRLDVLDGEGVMLGVGVDEGEGVGSRHCAATPLPTNVLGLLQTQAIDGEVPSVTKFALHVQADEFAAEVEPWGHVVQEGVGPPPAPEV
jgi:hypothetical protein